MKTHRHTSMNKICYRQVETLEDSKIGAIHYIKSLTNPGSRATSWGTHHSYAQGLKTMSGHANSSLLRLFFTLTTLICLVGCSDKKSSSTQTSQNKHTEDSVVIAKVGDRDITSSEFDAYLRFKRIKVRDEAQLDELLEKFVEREALAQAVQKADTLDQNAIEAELAEQRRELLISRYFDTHLRTSVTREGIDRYYVEHVEDYSVRRVKVAHILVRLNKKSSAEEKKAQRNKIEKAHTLLQSGTPFEEVARTLSEDRVSANRGGDMGYIKEGAIAPRFSKVAFSLKEGQFSEPVETGFGFHIIKTLEPPKTQKQPLETVEGDIRYKLRGEAKKAETLRLLKNVTHTMNRDGWTPKDQPVRAQTAVKEGAPKGAKQP